MKGIKTILHIFYLDLRSLLVNPVALAVLLGICALPSLYAWFNIAANMDPYSHTGEIAIAVASSDRGGETELTGPVNIGETLLASLEENDSLDWRFLDEAAAIEEVRAGRCYAAVIIPEDFSEDMLSVLSGDLRRPTLTYYVNEKTNPVAPKITDAGAGAIRDRVNEEFVRTAAQAAAQVLGDYTRQAEAQLEQSSQTLTEDLTEAMDLLETYQQTIGDFQTLTERSQETLQARRESLDQARDRAEEGLAALERGVQSLDTARSNAQALAEAMGLDLDEAAVLLGSLRGETAEAMDGINHRLQAVTHRVDGVYAVLQTVTALHQELEDLLLVLDQGIPGQPAAELLSRLAEDSARHQALLSALRTGNRGLAEAGETAAQAALTLDALLGDGKSAALLRRQSLTQDLLTPLDRSLDGFSSASGALLGSLTAARAGGAVLDQSLDSLSESLGAVAEALGSMDSTVTGIRAGLERTAGDLSALQGSERWRDLLRELEEADGEQTASFLSAPAELVTQSLYPVENYGSSMTPFYTNLAIWVGGIVLVSIFRLEVVQEESTRRLAPHQGFLARWLLFALVGQVQSLVVCGGDLWLLGVQCLHPCRFLLAGALASLVYVTLIYALSVAFRHVGKAICVVLVILQIPGSAGTYPIEMTPGFFQVLRPFLPFTYGIRAMRECIAGLYGHTYWISLGQLALFLPVAFFIGLALRFLMLNLNALFDEKLAETDLVLSEEGDPTRERQNLRLLLLLVAGDQKTRTKLEGGIDRFERSYRRLLAGGFVALAVVPSLFLILMFSINWKLISLILWIAALVLLALYLVVVEALYARLARTRRLLSMTPAELIRLIRRERKEEEP